MMPRVGKGPFKSNERAFRAVRTQLAGRRRHRRKGTSECTTRKITPQALCMGVFLTIYL